MSDLLGMSFDSSVSPSIQLKGWGIPDGVAHPPTGWGFAWYPDGGTGAVVVKDPMPTGDTPLSRVLRDWERFRSTTFLCHIRGAAKRVNQSDTHPFLRSYAGRDWLLVHDGQLDMGRLRTTPLENPALFEPVGHTDSEYLLCWLLAQLHERKLRRLCDIGWEQLHEWFRSFDEMGTLNLLLTDGHDVVGYRDAEGFSGLHYARRTPPHDDAVLENRLLTLDLGDPQDVNRSMVLFATTPIGQARWQAMAPGQMIAVRRGVVTWHSDSSSTGTEAAAIQPSESIPALTPVRAGGLRPQLGCNPAMISTPAPSPAAERIVTVLHETVYRYQVPVEQSSHYFRLRPVDDFAQKVLEHTLEIQPPGESHSFEDVFGNQVMALRFRQPYTELRVIARSRVRLIANPPVASRTRRTSIPLVWMPWQREMMQSYLLPPELPEAQLRELSDFAMSFVERQDYDLVETLHDINTTIRRDFAYVSKSTTLETTPFDVYINRRGVCQDFANLFICLARLLGVPARYRVGYIYTGTNYENTIQSDASHAWLEVYLPWAGWRGYDPTNGCLATLDHVRVAVGRNYRDATPTSGTIFKGGAGENLSVSVRVELDPS